jgi:hypothetical protein
MTFTQSSRGTEAYLYFAKDSPANLGKEWESITTSEKDMKVFVFPINPMGYGYMLYNV